MFDMKRRRCYRLRHLGQWRRRNHLKKKMAAIVADFMGDEERSFGRILDIGAHGGEMREGLIEKGVRFDDMVMMDDLTAFLKMTNHDRCVAGEAHALPFKDGAFDAVVSSLTLHAFFNLKPLLLEVKRVLARDGFFAGCLFGEYHLQEWRRAMLMAEETIRQGARMRFYPFMSINDAGRLLQEVGLRDGLCERDQYIVSYDHPMYILQDIRLMGESFPSKISLRKDIMTAAIRLYEAQFKEGSGVRTTMDIVTLIGRG